MDYIEICEWDRFQHYKHRNPPWVKLYSSVLDDDDFDCMPDASKLLFFCLLPFASRRNNRVRLDLAWLQKKLPINSKLTQKTLQPLIDAKFIKCYQDASNEIDGCKQNAMPEKSRVEKRQSREETEKKAFVFETARKKFPGTKRGFQVEFDNFKKKHPDWFDVVDLLLPAIEQQIEWRKKDGRYWKMFQTWINNSCWTEEKPQNLPETADERVQRLFKEIDEKKAKETA
jgi:hypothetical protein